MTGALIIILNQLLFVGHLCYQLYRFSCCSSLAASFAPPLMASTTQTRCKVEKLNRTLLLCSLCVPKFVSLGERDFSLRNHAL
jgi:hypothetical protein